MWGGWVLYDEQGCLIGDKLMCGPGAPATPCVAPAAVMDRIFEAEQRDGRACIVVVRGGGSRVA